MKKKSFYPLLITGLVGLGACISLSSCHDDGLPLSCKGSDNGIVSDDDDYEWPQDEAFTAPSLRQGDVLDFRFSDCESGEISKMDYRFTITGKKTADLEGVGSGSYEYQPSATGKTASFFFTTSKGLTLGMDFSTLIMEYTTRTSARVDAFVYDHTSYPVPTSGGMTGGTMTLYRK